MKIAIVVPSNNNCSPNKIVSYLCSKLYPKCQVTVFYLRKVSKNTINFNCPAKYLPLWNVFHLRQFDIIHSNLMKSDIICALVYKFFGGRVITTLHSDYSYDLTTYYKNKLFLFCARTIWGWALKNIKTLVPVSNSLAGTYKQYFPSSFIFPIQNGYYNNFLGGDNELDNGGRYYDVGIVSRLHPGKGIEDAIDLLHVNLELRLIVVGNGELLGPLMKRAELVLDRVYFRGYTETPAIDYKKMKIMIMPSKNEGFGMTILEAIYNGVPVVCFDTHVNREILGDGGRYYKDIIGLNENVTHMLNNREDILDAQVRGTSPFTIERMAKSYFMLYQNLMKQERSECGGYFGGWF